MDLIDTTIRKEWEKDYIKPKEMQQYFLDEMGMNLDIEDLIYLLDQTSGKLYCCELEKYETNKGILYLIE